MHMNELQKIEEQQLIEECYNRKHIDHRIREELRESQEVQAKIDQGVQLLEDWLQQDFYESKAVRLEQLKRLDLHQLVKEIFVGVAYVQRQTLYTSVTAQLAGRLGFDDKGAAITTVAEVMAVLALTDAYDVIKADKRASLMLVSRLPLSQGLQDFIADSEYLPPMICPPRKLLSNYDSGYLTHQESLILGHGNHHQGDLCLDVLDLVNSVPLAFDTDFLCQVEEVPTFDLDTRDKEEQWTAFKKTSYRFYTLIAKAGNRFWLTHRVDKRGRIYASGYHVSTQGTAFKKASIELADQELVDVPTQYRR